MSDKKDKSDADLEANLAKIANAKPRRRNRKDNIYERFITRVESIEEAETLESLRSVDFATTANNDTNTSIEVDLRENPIQKNTLKPLKNADKLSSYEPLSAAELDLFTIQDQNLLEDTVGFHEADNNTASVSLDFSDRKDEEAENLEKSSYAADTNEIEVLAVKEQDIDDIDDNEENVNARSLEEPSLKKAQKKDVKSSTLASSKKPLVMGMVLGSLMIGGAVLTLIATGVLTTEPNAVSMPFTEDVNQPSSTSNSEVNANEQNNVDANTTPSEPTVSTIAGEPSANITATADKPLEPNPKKTKATADESEVSAPKAEPAITYEDFREESQSTLYRETND